MRKVCLFALLLCLSSFLAAKSLPLAAPDGMVYVEGGSFQMGSADGENNEKPLREVSVSPFFIGKYEVTQDQWREVMGYDNSYFTGTALPVERVSWYEAVEFCNKLSLKEGLSPCYVIDSEDYDPYNKSTSDDLKWIVSCVWTANGYRLPTEAEWEYAARGGSRGRGYLYSGSDSLGAVAWYEENSGWSSQPIGTKAPNELGVHDLTGNVQEWCWDWYGRDYYADGQNSDPRGPESGSYRVLRGGSWFNNDYNCRNAVRYYFIADCQYFYFGFRVARSAL
jgi:formylglycine-generating enzyme required for sulfatase activity